MQDYIILVNPSYLNIIIDLAFWYPKVWFLFYLVKAIFPQCKPHSEVCRTINYFLLWLTSLYLEINYLLGNNCYLIIGLYYIKTIVCMYIYENTYLKLDKAHILHHNLTIFMLIFSLNNDILHKLWLIRLITIPTLAYISSIFSSLRKYIFVPIDS